MPAIRQAARDDAAAMPVRVYVLGGFRLERDRSGARPVQAQNRPLSLLKTLIALGGEHVPVDTLCDALWPDADGDAAHNAFHATLNRLRKTMGSSALGLRGKRLSLDFGSVWVDARACEQVLAQAARHVTGADTERVCAAMNAALELYRGPLLDGEFEPLPVLSARERFQSRLLRHVAAAGAYLMDRNEISEAIRLYRRGLDVDPCSEELYQCLMRACLAQGRIAEGLEAYDRCRQALEHHFGIAPSHETQAIRGLLHARAGGDVTADRPGRPEQPMPLAPDPLAPRQLVRLSVQSFVSLDGAAANTPFCQGLTQDLVTELSRIPALTVFSVSPVSAAVDPADDASAPAEDHGELFILKGNARRSGKRVRVNASLHEAGSGRQVWAERFETGMVNPFHTQDEIVQRIVIAVDVYLLEGEKALRWRRTARNPEAYGHMLKGLYIWRSHLDRDAYLVVRELLERALEIDPELAIAHAFLGWLLVQVADVRIDPDDHPQLELARSHIERAIALSPELDTCHSALSHYHLKRRQYDQALEAAERAVAGNPISSEATAMLAQCQVHCGMHQLAIRTARRALRLGPSSPPWYRYTIGIACLLGGVPEEAVLWLRQVVQELPNSWRMRLWLVAAHVALNQQDGADREAAAVLRMKPHFDLERWVHRMIAFRNEADWNRLMGLLRQASWSKAEPGRAVRQGAANPS